MDLYGKTLLELSDLLKSKEISSSELFQYFQNRSEKLNTTLNAFITINSAEAEVKFDQMQTENSSTPKNVEHLQGLPIAIKDNFCTHNVRTTAASEVLEDFIPKYNATVVEKLLGSGVSFVGKTNMDAWAHGSSGETSFFGATKNPWDLDKAPGGSSSGSAAAVAAYMVPAAIGSETAGSIRLPASWSGVVGFKPTYGRVSRYGVAAMGSSLDSPGPMTLTVKDSALLLNAIAGKDSFDATTSPIETEDYLQALEESKTYTIGVPKSYFEGCTPDVQKSVEDAIKVYEKLGYKVKEIELLDPEYSIAVYTILQRAEVSSNLARLHGVRYSKDRSKFGKEAKKRTMIGAYTLAHGYYDAYYKKALKVRTLIIEDFKRVFSEVDLIASPVAPITAIKLGEFEKYSYFGELMDKLNEPSSIAGLPAISIPCGLDSNEMPIGLQLIGNYWKESDILRAAHAYELETDFNGVIKKGLEKWKNIEQ